MRLVVGLLLQYLHDEVALDQILPRQMANVHGLSLLYDLVDIDEIIKIKCLYLHWLVRSSLLQLKFSLKNLF